MRQYHPHKDNKNRHGCLVPPSKDGNCYGISYAFKDAETAEKMFAGEIMGYMYHGTSRGQEVVTKLEKFITDGETSFGTLRQYDALATASGMAAIDLLYHQLRATLGKNEIIFSPHVYGGVYNHFVNHLSKCGFVCRVVHRDFFDPRVWLQYSTKKTLAFHIETPSNPTCDIFDIESFAKAAHSQGILLVCDNTIATFVLQQPLKHGADIVVNSLTKGINGHSEELGGMIVANKGFINALRNDLCAGTRPVMSPRAAECFLKRCKGLKERMIRASKNAYQLASDLNNTSHVSEVYSPAIKSGNTDSVRKQMVDCGGLLQFDIDGGKKEAYRFLNSLRRVLIAPHLGHNQTLAIAPRFTTHSKMPLHVQDRIGITDASIRVSVGSQTEEKFARDSADIMQALIKAFI